MDYREMLEAYREKLYDSVNSAPDCEAYATGNSMFKEATELMLPLIEALEAAKRTFKNCVPNAAAYQTDVILTEALANLREKLNG